MEGDERGIGPEKGGLGWFLLEDKLRTDVLCGILGLVESPWNVIAPQSQGVYSSWKSWKSTGIWYPSWKYWKSPEI